MRWTNPLFAWRQGELHRDLERQIARVERYLAPRDEKSPDRRPVLFFNSSTRIHRLSQNAAFGLLASWAVRAQGIPVRHLVCQRGMVQCVLGTDRRRLGSPPPCQPCLRLSEVLFPESKAVGIPLEAAEVATASAELRGRPMSELTMWEHRGLPLGELCLPSLRWALRVHHLPDSDSVRSLFRQYLVSGASLAARMEETMAKIRPRALAVFNGIFYPEAVARKVAQRLGVPVVTHEVGLRPLSAFFSHREATFRQLDIQDDLALTPGQEALLDRYLNDRFRGQFTMAGVRFWPEMRPLPGSLTKRRAEFAQMVVVFPNVIFDTSQVHANVVYPDMFAWLTDLLTVFDQHPETLFVLRAHPDEGRPGKESRETVEDWTRRQALSERANVVFLPPQPFVSSYELIRQAKLVLIYNSSVGLEAAILGKPVLSAGRARFGHLPLAGLAGDLAHYREMLEAHLAAPEGQLPVEHVATGRRWLYVEAFLASLDLSPFLTDDPGHPGMVRLRPFHPETLSDSPELTVIRDGILEGKPFLLAEEGRAEGRSRIEGEPSVR